LLRKGVNIVQMPSVASLSNSGKFSTNGDILSPVASITSPTVPVGSQGRILPPLLQGQAALIHDRSNSFSTSPIKEGVAMGAHRVSFASGSNIDDLIMDLDSFDYPSPTYLPALPPPQPVNAAFRRKSGGGKSPPPMIQPTRRDSYRDALGGYVIALSPTKQ
jgi:hypothetical protein